MLYVIDPDDRLVAFDSAFRAFAVASGVPALPEEWLGRSLWEAGASPEIDMVFRSLVARARQGLPVSVPTRCDSLRVERFVQMEITAAADGRVAFSSKLTRMRAKEGTTPATPLRACAWCFREACPQLDEADSCSLPSPFEITSSPV